MYEDDENHIVMVSGLTEPDTTSADEPQKFPKRYPVEDSAYKRSFVKCLTTVFENELYLFNQREVACLSHYLFTLTDDARYIFARLFLRTQRKWFRESDYIQYDRDCDIHKAVQDSLIPYYYMPDIEYSAELDHVPLSPEPESEAFMLQFDYTQPLTDILELLNVAELKTLSSTFNVSTNKRASPSTGAKSSSKSRASLISDLSKATIQASLFSFFKPESSDTVLRPKSETHDRIISSAKSFLGSNVIRINPFVHKTIARAFTVYFRVKDFEVNYVECALLYEMSLNKFPTYTIQRRQNFFSSRNEHVQYEEALNLRLETEALVTGKVSDSRKGKALALFKKLESRLEIYLQAAAFSSHTNEELGDSSLSRSIAFTPEWVGIRAALMLCTGCFGDFESEWRFLELFLKQSVYHRAQRGKAYIRKAILEMNQLSGNLELAQEASGSASESKEQFSNSLITAYYQYSPSSMLPKRKRSTGNTKTSVQKGGEDGELTIASNDKLTSGIKLFWTRKALQTCIEGIQDATIHEVFHIDLKKRIERLEKQLKIPMRSRHDFSYATLTLANSRTIKCNRILESVPELTIEYPSKKRPFETNDKAGPSSTVITSKSNPFKRPLWVDIEGTRDSVNVEEASLSYYRTLGWEGVHSENSMLATLFALLFWDILFSPLISEKSGEPVPGIFEHHCQTFPLDLFSKTFYRNRKEAIDTRLGLIQSDIAFMKRQVTQVYKREQPRQTLCIGVAWYPLEALLTIVEGLGVSAVAIICEHLAKNYRVMKSGMPDLCLWKISTKECMFSEVKSENDTLSDKQCYWIDILMNAGVTVEVCHVLEPKSYLKKVKLS